LTWVKFAAALAPQHGSACPLYPQKQTFLLTIDLISAVITQSFCETNPVTISGIFMHHRVSAGGTLQRNNFLAGLR